MKNHKIILLLLNIFTLTTLPSDYCSNFKVRAGAFIPQSKLFRRIYGKAGAFVDVEVATRLTNHLDFWANLDLFYKRGRSIGLCSLTKIAISRLSLGIKVPYQGCYCERISPYLGLGASFGALWLRNWSALCCKEKVFNGAAGIVIKAGTHVFVRECGFLDFFIDYLYQPTRFPQRKVNIGGTKIGIGGGFNF
jgi:hypothetical protein